MTVSELAVELQKYQGDAEVLVLSDKGELKEFSIKRLGTGVEDEAPDNMGITLTT